MPAQDLEKLVVQLSADMRKYENAMARAQALTNQRARAIESRLSGMSKKISGQFSLLGSGLGKGIAAIGGAVAFQSVSDAATNIRNSLKVAGLSGEELETTFDKLYAAAQRNSVPIDSLAQLYSRVSLNQKELGVSTDQLTNLTENVGKALRISGADAQSANGALLQLAQALGSSKVQAEEYGSLIDTMPALLQAAANGIEQAGGSVSKLTQLVKSGQISNKAFFDGIESGQRVLDDRLVGSVQTVGQRFITLRNAVVKAADRFNENTDAADALGKEFGQLAGYIDALDFSQLVSDMQGLLAILETGAGKAQAFALELSKITGLRHAGAALVDALPGEGVDGKKTYLGGLLTVQASLNEANLLKENAERRLSIERQIAALKTVEQSPEVQRNLQKLQAQLGSIPKNPKQPGITTPAYALPGGSPLPAAPDKPKVDINDSRYKPPADTESDRKARKERLDDYEREIQQIRDRTSDLRAETAARGELNPLVEDYGFAVEKAAAKQDLMNAAQAAGQKMTPQLSSEIDTLATAYANAVVAAEQLSQKQDRIREAAEEAREFNKDLTRGIVDGFVSGAKAADLFADSLKKIGDRLLDVAFDSLFDPKSSGGFDLFGSIGGLLGIGKRERGGPVAAGKPYIVGEKRPELFVPSRSGMIMPRVPDMGALSKGTKSGGTSVALHVNIDARGADESAVLSIRKEVKQLKADLPGLMIKAVKNGQGRRLI